jgi:hypothetical protein
MPSIQIHYEITDIIFEKLKKNICEKQNIFIIFAAVLVMNFFEI